MQDTACVAHMESKLLPETDAERVILIMSGKPPKRLPDAVKEVFHVLRLQFAIVDHDDYVPHRRLSAKEADAVLAKFNSDREHIPKMFFGDPVARFHGWQEGDMIEILVHEVRAAAPHSRRGRTRRRGLTPPRPRRTTTRSGRRAQSTGS